jgi:2',3'-cyclic-nucleotide 2'-phosphodiesterase/3'-nucleotidase/5'-nucleotidase
LRWRESLRTILAVATLALGMLGASSALAAVLAGWDVHGLTGGANNFGASPLAATVSDPSLTVGGLTRGSGVSTTGTAAARAWGGTDWQTASAAAAVGGNDYATVTVTANAGSQVSFASVSRLDYRRSSTGPASGVLQYQIGSGAFTDIAALGFTVTTSTGGTLGPIDLSGIAALQNVPAGTTVTFRIVNYGGTSSGGTWYVWDYANTTANDLEISGTVSASGPANGTCGSANGQTFAAAPTANLCSVGTPSAVAGSGPWTWTCAGSGGGTTANCSASKYAGGPFSIYHMNDTHARLTPHKWIIPSTTSTTPVFEDVGGAAYVAGKMLALTTANPNSLVIDAGDISEGNPIGDMIATGCAAGGTLPSSNCGMTQFYAMLSNKLKLVSGRNGRGMDAVVVGNHDVRDSSYIANLETLAATGVPVLSVNVRDLACTSSHPRYPSCEHFAPYSIVTINGTKVGILGYTTSAAEVGAALATTLDVVDCDWSGTAATCHLSDYVNTLRNTEHVDVVVLVAHIGHGALVDQNPAVGPNLLVDNGVAKLPEVVVTGHWHTWTDTAWQPYVLNYKTTFSESSSYFKYIGELNVDATGKYQGAAQHVLRNADITPDSDVLAFVDDLKAQYLAAHPGHPVDEVVGYTDSNLILDNDMRWWSPDEYPWGGNNTAGQWITDAMQWKCAQLFGACDLAIETGGGVRADIPAGPVTYLQVYETFPWSDDTFVRIDMTGQDIVNFLKEVNLNAGFSSALDVTAVDGLPTVVKFNGQPIDLNHTYTVAINNYMYAHPPSGYAWPTHSTPLTNSALMRDGIVEYMRTQHATPATAYQIGGARYHFNGEFSGGFRAVVTMMNDQDTRPTYGAAFVRFLSATPDTLARRGDNHVPADLVNADGSVNAGNRLSSMEIYRSYLGFKPSALVPGDIVEFRGKASFYGGSPEFVDQEGIYADGQEFRVVGHDASLAKPEYLSSIGALLNDKYKNHYVQFIATKTAADTVADQFSRSLKIWDKTGYTAAALPGNVGDKLLISGVLTMENYGFRFRRDQAAVTTSPLPATSGMSSRIDPLTGSASAPITLSATAMIVGAGYELAPIADAQVASGNPTTNYGTSTNLYIQSSTASFGNERTWLKFDLSGIPAGSTITGATLQMWNWKSAGATLPVEVRSATDDSWTEAGLNWNTQPALGAVLDTRNLTSGTTNVWYGWNVTSFVQGQWAGDKVVSLMAKAVTEGSSDATAPSYAFDAKEYGSNGPVLQVTTQATATSIANVRLFYRYSADNANWGTWTQVGPTLTAAPYTAPFSFPQGYGYYEFYSVATDNLGNVEPTPAYAQASVHHQAASGAAQTITFAPLAVVPVGSSFSVSATASSGLAVAFSSQTTSVCTVAGNVVTALAVGTCTIAADQSGEVDYWLPAPTVARSFAVQGLAQTISFPAIGNQVLGAAPFGVTATATSGLPVTIVSQTTSVCSVTGNTVTLLMVGTCTLAATQAGDGTYSAAPNVTVSFVVTSGSGGGSQGSNGDVPIPLWALALLGAGLLGAAQRRRG